jgi:thiol-disulfide isomerase/thioredoxin
MRPLPTLLLSVAFSSTLFGCRDNGSTLAENTPDTTATTPATSGFATATSTAFNPYQSEKPNTPHHLAMQLPQPLPEPTPAQDPSQYVAAEPPWPQSLIPVFGSELVGRVKAAGKRGVLINAWASWCGPCKVEMPMLVKLRDAYLERGLDVWFVSVNQSSEAAQVLQVLNERKVPGPHYVAKGIIGYFIDALSPIWQGSLPSTFLYDATGRLRYFWGAHAFEQEITPVLDDFLAGKAIDGVANVQVRKGPEGPSTR